MLPRSKHLLATAVSATLVVLPFGNAMAGIGQTARQPVPSVLPILPEMACGGQQNGGGKPPGGDINININKSVNIYKPTVINKPITINKNINVYKPVTINKNIEINKNIDINKTIIIKKDGGDAAAMASAFAVAVAAAAASASASVNNQISVNVNGSANANASARAGIVVYGGNSYESVTINNYAGLGNLNVVADKKCVYQEATVVKAIHAVCVSAEGREFAASHMTGDTWINSAYEGEVVRCIAGSRLKVTIGQVVQSDQGMATTYGNGEVLMCELKEALRHYKDGLLKCAPAVAVEDCVERTNLRRYGSGDLFFSFRTQVCAEIFEQVASRYSQQSYSRETEIEDLSLQGGVGGGY